MVYVGVGAGPAILSLRAIVGTVWSRRSKCPATEILTIGAQ